MKKLIRILIVLIIVTSLLSFVGNAAGAPTYHWKIAHIRPVGTDHDTDINWLVDKIKEDSGGRIVIDVFPASILGDYEVVQERVGLGDIEMQLACVGTKMDRRLMIQSLPYLIKNWDEARKIYGSGSFFMDIISDLLEEQNLKVIACYPVYFGGIALVKLPPSPGDPDVPKNIKIRVPPQKSFELNAESLGYLATPIPWSEAFTSMQTGIVDGAIGAGAEGYYANFRDLIKYYLAVNDHFEQHYTYMNLDLWKSLSKEDQKIIMDASMELEKRRFAVAEEREQFNMQRLRDYGIEVLTFTDEELERFAKKCRENVWPKIKEDIGPELMDKVLGQLGQ